MTIKLNAFLIRFQSTPVQWPPPSYTDNQITQLPAPGPKPKISLVQPNRGEKCIRLRTIVIFVYMFGFDVDFADTAQPPEPRPPSHGTLKTNGSSKKTNEEEYKRDKSHMFIAHYLFVQISTRRIS